MNKSERPRQLRLGGDFGGDTPKLVIEAPKKEEQSEHPNAPEGSTHMIAQEKEVFFAIEPQPEYGSGSYDNVYTVKKPFYAEYIREEGKWEYFKVKGMTKDKLFGVFYRGKRIGLAEGTIFKTKKSNRIKI
ncbi:MAG: hypothetical protein OEX81_00530 [Candidatus Pacebacteria bacterium]|nr:hypothetical protein [Candidatus Paceibacterota bacterium]